MASLTLALCLSFLLTWKMVPGQKLSSSDRQERSFVSAHAGEDLTLRCFYDTQVPTSIYWYKQILGQRPKLISVSSKNDKNLFHGEIENSTHFKMDKRDGKALLTITDLHTSDSAIYHCIFYSYVSPIFSESVTVSVKGFGSNATLVNQPVSDSIQPGGFATLSCTVHPGSCDGEHSVYWYKKSEESLPVLFYTHGGMNDQCDSQSNTCFYELPMENLTRADAGMYYCAVASCGQVLFGNGTNLDIRDDIVHFWKGAFIFTTALSALLAFSICVIIRTNSCQPAESFPGLADAKGYPTAGSLYVAALSVNLADCSRRRDPTWSACVYYSVKQSHC
ncbi:uncharacterized protein LOC115395742 [Salarias fasciatus]|uniref:uncharacterized protein LOC115395742 n=1 Tax=Salarias fasciatus TaxID=181472 RepID=UPI001176BC9D|nr:uncharacterized protein LOC115395742 [Salarias fasciatus]